MIAILTSEHYLDLLKNCISFNTNLIRILGEIEQNKQSEIKETWRDLSKIMKTESIKHKWFKEELSDIFNEDIITQLLFFIKFSGEYTHQFRLPKKENLLTIKQYKEYIDLESKLSSSYFQNTPWLVIDYANIVPLKNMFDTLIEQYNKAEEIELNQAKKIITDYFNGNIVFWEKQLLISMEIINGMDKDNLIKIDQEISIQYKTTTYREKLKMNAEWLINYLDKGHTISGFLFSIKKLFLPKKNKEKFNIINTILINGSTCNTKNKLENVIQHLSLKLDFQKLSQIWNIKPYYGASFAAMHTLYKKCILESIDLISIIDATEKILAKIQNNIKVSLTPFNKKQALLIQKEIEHQNLLKIQKGYKKTIEQTEELFRNDILHPIILKILRDYRKPNIEKYENTLVELSILTKKNDLQTHIRHAENALKKVFPSLVQSITKGTRTQPDLPMVKNAILFNYAYTILKSIKKRDYDFKFLYDELSELHFLEKKIPQKIALQEGKKNTSFSTKPSRHILFNKERLKLNYKGNDLFEVSPQLNFNKKQY